MLSLIDEVRVYAGSYCTTNELVSPGLELKKLVCIMHSTLDLICFEVDKVC